MKKIFLSSAAMLLLMTSCAGTSNSSSQESSLDSSVAASSSSSAQGGSSVTSESSPEKSQTSEEPPVVKAKIKSITALDYLFQTTNYVKLTGVEAGTEYEAGAKVTLTFAAGSSLSLGFSASYAKDIYVYVNDDLYHPTFNEATSKMSLTFEMPEVDVDLQYCYMTSNTAGLTWSFKNLGDYSVRGIDLSKAYTSAISLYLVGPENKQITSLKYETDTGDKGDLDLTTCIDIGGGVYYLKDLSVYSEGATAVTVSLATADAAEHTITYTGLDETKVDVAKSVLPTKGYEGKQTKISVVPVDEHATVSLSFTGVSASATGGEATFTMPANNITVTIALLSPINVSDVVVNYVGDSTPSCVVSSGFYEYSYGSGYVEVNTLELGKSYYFRVQLNSADYSMTAAKLNGVDSSMVGAVTYPDPIANAYQAYFTIPSAASLTLEVTLGMKYSIIIPSVDNVTVSAYCGNTQLTNGSEVAAGSKVSVTAYDSSWNYYSVAVLDAGTETDISTDVGLSVSYGTYTFTMPSKAIKLSITAPSTDA